jgi:preprotein translocase subunit SecA
MRLFGSERVMKIIDALGMPEDEPIEHKMLSSAIENAQKKVEANHFGTRKHLNEYDQVMNEQREVIYGERRKVLLGADLKESILTMMKNIVTRSVDLYTGESENPELWDIIGLNEHIHDLVPIDRIRINDGELDTLTKDELCERVYNACTSLYEKKEREIESEMLRELERVILLKVIDQRWMDHIDDMDQMRQGITLRAYAQRDPLVEYKFLSFDMFDEMSQNIETGTVRALSNIRVQTELTPRRERVAKNMFTNKDTSAAKAPARRKEAKIGRNDPCTCGSNKKYKQCCGK